MQKKASDARNGKETGESAAPAAEDTPYDRFLAVVDKVVSDLEAVTAFNVYALPDPEDKAEEDAKAEAKRGAKKALEEAKAVQDGSESEEPEDPRSFTETQVAKRCKAVVLTKARHNLCNRLSKAMFPDSQAGGIAMYTTSSSELVIRGIQKQLKLAGESKTTAEKFDRLVALTIVMISEDFWIYGIHSCHQI